MKPIYTAVNHTAARAALDELTSKWAGKYPAMIWLWENAWEEFIPFLDYDALTSSGLERSAGGGDAVLCAWWWARLAQCLGAAVRGSTPALAGCELHTAQAAPGSPSPGRLPSLDRITSASDARRTSTVPTGGWWRRGSGPHTPSVPSGRKVRSSSPSGVTRLAIFNPASDSADAANGNPSGTASVRTRAPHLPQRLSQPG